MKTEDLFDAGDKLKESKKAIANIIDLKIDSDMRETLTRMEVMFDKVNARIDKLETSTNLRMENMDKHIDRIDRRMDRMDNTMRWGFGIIITLMLAMKFFK